MAFVDSMVMGIKVINFSSSFFEEEEVQKQKSKNEESEKDNTLLMVLVVAASLAISIGLFMVLPVLISNLFKKLFDDNVFLLYLMEGILGLLFLSDIF